MQSIGLKDLCLEIVAGTAGRFLDLQWSDGRFATRPEHETDEWNFYDQQYILAAAVLYSSAHPGNSWHGNERLWQAILRDGRHIASRIGEDGSMTWRLNGVVLGRPFVCQRLTCAWLQAYRLLKSRLPEADAALWRESIIKACQWLVDRHLVPHRDVVRFTSHDVGTGTNHFSLYLSLIWLAGTEFGRPEWVALASGLMRRLIADQRPGGYWEEHHGPALGYNYLTYDGVGQYTIWSGDGAGHGALRAGLDLHKHWTYPDGIPVECIDGRMRHLSHQLVWGLAGFTRSADGRGYARLMLERLHGRGDDLSGETVARVAEAYLLSQEGGESEPPQKQREYRATLDEVSVIRKRGPWVAALSGQCSEPWPENQFCLDRQALASVWREGAGLAIDGSNSKLQPELATFRDASGDGAYMPLEARLASVNGRYVVEYRYATFRARVAARIVGEEAVELEFRVTDTHGGPVTMAIVPHVSYGESLTIEGTGTVALGDGKTAIRDAGPLWYRGVTLRPPAGAAIEYPVSPFNSYSADNTSTPSANRMVVRCTAGKQPVVWRVEAE